MKKDIVIALSAALVLSSCGSYTGSGAYTGASLGSILGSAIGGISDGPRGSDIGTLIGLAGGAVVGAAIGQAADNQRLQDLDQYHRDKAERAAQRRQRQQAQQQQQRSYNEQDQQDSGFDSTNSGDDRIYDFNGSDYTGNYSAQQPQTMLPGGSSVEQLSSHLTYSPALEVVNARFVDDNEDNQISRGEMCKVIFEVMNRSQEALYDVEPTVLEMTGNKHIYISPSMHVEKIEPGKGIRYTALVKADNRLKDGNVKIVVSVLQGGKTISKVSEFNIPTSR